MNATFARATDGQIVLRVIPADTTEGILLEVFVEEAGQKVWVVEQPDKTVLLYPKQPQ